MTNIVNRDLIMKIHLASPDLDECLLRFLGKSGLTCLMRRGVGVSGYGNLMRQVVTA